MRGGAFGIEGCFLLGLIAIRECRAWKITNIPTHRSIIRLDEVAGKVVKYIRELKPDIVLTFDPIGGYRHPDHIHIQQATVLAFEKSE